MIKMTYLKERRDIDDTLVISFEGNAEDVYAIRDYAESLNKRKTACEHDYGMCDSEIGSVTTCTSGYLEIDDIEEDDDDSGADFYINIKPKLDFSDFQKAIDKLMAENIEEIEELEQESNEEDLVNSPKHYVNSGMECIDEMIMIFGEEAVMNFCLCNCWKYRKRALDKGQRLDLEKSDWYIAKYKELKEIIQKKKIAKHDKFVMDMRRLLENGASLHLDEPEFARLYKRLFPLD